MTDKFTNVEVASVNKRHSNEAETSLGSEVLDDIDYTLPTDEYDIVEVYDDVILGEFCVGDCNEDGEKITDGGIYLADGSDDIGGSANSGDGKLFKVMKILLVGDNVKYAKVGHHVVVSKTGGMKIVEFDGRECVMVREPNIFMRVVKKEIIK